MVGRDALWKDADSVGGGTAFKAAPKPHEALDLGMAKRSCQSERRDTRPPLSAIRRNPLRGLLGCRARMNVDAVLDGQFKHTG